MAGFHLNGAPFRIAVIYRRTLKITVGRHTTRDDVRTLHTHVENLHRQWKKSRMVRGHVHRVHKS
jgi:hypothetical protein